MSTSELGHYVRFGETAIDSLDPVDTGMARRAIGNLSHIADQYAQRRIAWVSHGSTLDTIVDTTVAGTFWRLWTSHPFDLHVQANHESYRCRVRLRVSSGSASNKATFRAVLAPYEEREAEAGLYGTRVNATEIEVTQTAYTWEDGAALIYLDAPLVGRASERATTIDSIGGEATRVQWLRAHLSVWVDVAATASIASLGGVQLDEYVAP